MWNWYRRWRRPIVLHVMRLDQMYRVHPEMIQTTCRGCGETVGVYPSGQRVIAKFGKRRTHLMCNMCMPVVWNDTMLAPGAYMERFRSHDRET